VDVDVGSSGQVPMVPLSSSFLVVGAMLIIGQWEVRWQATRCQKALASDSDLPYRRCRVLGRGNSLGYHRRKDVSISVVV
jgi:hypothetical protein